MERINKHIAKLKKDGFTIIENILSKKDCEFFINRSNLLLKKLLKKKKTTAIYQNFQQLIVPFRYDRNFFRLLYFKTVDKILTNLLDKNYVIIDHSVLNRRVLKHKFLDTLHDKPKWHTDSRYLGGKRLDKGFSYIALLMLDDFKKNNSTLYVPGSHLLRNKPKRNGNYKYKIITGKKGSMLIFDSGLWHQGGSGTNEDRWSICNYYGPWWMKPYYRFTDMLGLEKMKKLDYEVRKLLHYYSTPPKKEREGKNTYERTRTLITNKTRYGVTSDDLYK